MIRKGTKLLFVFSPLFFVSCLAYEIGKQSLLFPKELGTGMFLISVSVFGFFLLKTIKQETEWEEYKLGLRKELLQSEIK